MIVNEVGEGFNVNCVRCKMRWENISEVEMLNLFDEFFRLGRG